LLRGKQAWWIDLAVPTTAPGGGGAGAFPKPGARLGQEVPLPRPETPERDGQAHLKTPSGGRKEEEEKAQDLLPCALGLGRGGAVPASSSAH